MIKRLYIFFLFIFIISFLVSCNRSNQINQNDNLFSEGLLAVSKDGKWGYIDKNGIKVIDYKYDYAYAFYHSRAIVEEAGTYYLIDKKEKKLVEIGFESFIMRDQETGYIWFKNLDSNLYGFMDNDGKVIAEAMFDNYSSFSEGLAAVSKDGLYGYIDSGGNLIIEYKYLQASNFNLKQAIVKTSTGFGVINPQERFLLDAIYDDVKIFNEDNRTTVTVNGVSELIDKDNKVIISADEIIGNGPFYAVKNSEGLFGVFDKNGKRIIEEKYIQIIFESNNIIMLTDGNNEKNIILLDDDGTIIRNQPVSSSLAFFKNDFIFEKVDDGFYLHKKGRSVSFEGTLLQVKNGLLVVEKDNRYGIVNLQNQKVVDFKYDYLILYDDGIIFYKNELFGVLSLRGNVLINPQFEGYNPHNSEKTNL